MLIVDDNDAYRAGMVRTARAHPEIELVAEVDGGHEALDAIDRLRPDAALVDLRMPCVDGLEVCRRVADMSPPPACRVIILSGADVDESVRDAVLDAGAVAFLTKDLPRREILHAVLLRCARIAA
jgi:DNA-binding NarL/FixJ family response regulator